MLHSSLMPNVSPHPVGAVIMFGGATAPIGWLLCNGSAVSRTTYSALYNVIGTTYGVGDGSTTFNVPDFRGRVILGAGTGSGLTSRLRGATGGAETHQLSTAELAAHTHTQKVQAGSGGGNVPAGGSYQIDNWANTNTGSAGSDSAHNNMQPWGCANAIIRATPGLEPLSAAYGVAPTGTILETMATSAPDGWILLTGASAIRTIGDASSGADRANADTSVLYALVYAAMTNTEAPVSSGRGASAAADYAAHKTLTLPEVRGRCLIGSGTGGSLTARTHGAVGGAETHQLSVGELASHTHGVTQGYTTAGSGGNAPYMLLYQSYPGSLENRIGNTGSNTAHANMQPWTAMHRICKL